MADPLGITCSNPFNLEGPPGSAIWLGMSAEQPHLPYLSFDDPVYGLRAGMIDALNKIARGLDTLAKIIPVFAPAGDNNNVSAYVSDVAARLAIDPNAKLDLSTEDALISYAKAIVLHENGHPVTADWFTASTWREAAILALSHQAEKAA